MSSFRVRKLADAEVVSYGPQSDLCVLIGDEQRTTPIRVAMQNCKPGYVVPVHCHAYVEYLIVMEGSAEFRIEADGVQTVCLQKGDSVELHAGVWHSFTTSGSDETRLMGIHLSAERIVNYKPGVKTDARGFRISDEVAS